MGVIKFILKLFFFTEVFSEAVPHKSQGENVFSPLKRKGSNDGALAFMHFVK